MAQSAFVIRPPSQSDFVSSPADVETGGGGGGATVDPEYTLVTDWGALSDPSARVASSSHSGGLVAFTMTGDTVQYDGFTEALPRRVSNLLTHVPGFNPETDDLELYLEVRQLPTQLSPPAYGLVAILSDRNGDVANQGGIGFSVRASTATTQAVQAMGATAGQGTLGTAFQPIGAVRAMISFARQSNTNWLPNLYTQSTDTMYDAIPVTSYGNGTQMLDNTTNWELQIGIVHANTTTGTPTIRGLLHVRAVPRAARHPDLHTAEAKPTSGTMVVAVIGDSTAGGFGGDQDPPDGDAGLALPSGVTLTINGTPQATWPYTINNAPNPGFLSYFAGAAIADGYAAVDIHVWYASGRELPALLTNEFQDLREDLANDGIQPETVDAVITSIGTNDGSTSGKAAIFAALSSRAYNAMQRTFPNARILAIKPAVAVSFYPDVATVNTAIAAAVAERPATRVLVDAGVVPVLVDNVHPTPAGYALQGVEAYAEWDALV